MIPRNLFGMAMSVLPRQTAVLYRWQNRQTNAIGLDVDSYAAEPLTGNIQAVDRARYDRLGLDAAKSYITVFTDTPIDDLTRTKNPDHIGWQGERYEVLNRAGWNVQAGFNGVMAVCIGPDKGAAHGT